MDFINKKSLVKNSPFNYKRNQGIKAYYYGKKVEYWARWYLRLKGYRILENRYATKVGEIDIIAKKGSILIFFEVKARDSFMNAAQSISFKQINRIKRATEFYIMKNYRSSMPLIRFDVLLVKGFSFPLHIKNAF